MTDSKQEIAKRRTPRLLETAIRNAATRKKPSGLNFALADRIGLLRGADWDTVTHDASVFLNRSWLTAVEQAGPRELLLRYGLIYRESRPVCCFVTQTLDLHGDQLVKSGEQLSEGDRAQLAVKKLTRKALNAIHRRVMMCGNVVSWGPHGVAFRDGESPDELWPAVAEGLYRTRRGDRLQGQTDYVILKDLPEALSQSASPLEQYSYRRLETEPDMVLEVDGDWNGFDDYLGSLNKKYRKSAKTVLSAFDKAGATVETLDSCAPVADRLHSLYQQVANRADVRLVSMPAAFFPAIESALGTDCFATIGISADKTLCGFVTVIRDGDTAIGYYLGLDYESNGHLPVYHRLLYAVIEQAIRWKCRRISFGRTALDAKARLGCMPVPTFLWIRHRVPVLNLIVRQLLQAVPHAEPPERSPFKAG